MKSISDTSECVPVNFDIRVDYLSLVHRYDGTKSAMHTFPTEGKPTNPTDATPVLTV